MCFHRHGRWYTLFFSEHVLAEAVKTGPGKERPMRAAMLTGLKQVAIQEMSAPTPGPGEVLVRVTHVGVCGSDVHYWKHGRIGDAVIQHPYVVGHEVAGEVEALGPGVEAPDLAPGTPVAIEPGIPCFQCPACRAGLPHCCPHVRFFGTPPVPGAFCDKVVTEPSCLVPLPDGVSLEAAAVVEPLGVAVHAVNISSLKPGMKVGVFGMGPVGLLTLQVALAGGAVPVYGTERIPERISAARAMGADTVLDPDGEPAGPRIAAETGGLDLVFEAAGDPAAVNDGFAALKPGGTLVIIGIPDPGPSGIDFHVARRKELSVIFSRRSNFETHQCLRLLEKNRVTTDGLVTHRFPLEELQDAFCLLDAYGDGVIKAMITL